MRHLGVERKMMAERLVIWRAKLKISPAMKAGRMRGRVTRRKVYWALAPKFDEASSMDGSICCKAATPARTEAGKLRTA